MKAILLAAVMIAANTVNADQPRRSMTLEGEGVVYSCINEDVNPYGTCFEINGERWGVDELFDRSIGETIQVRFIFEYVPSDDGDTYRVHHIEPIYYGENDPNYN